jgi:glutathione S-transferase
MLRFDGFTSASRFKQRVAEVSPAGQVPVLLDGELAVWDTLAIAEYLAERFPQHRLWPAHPAHRARARSICAEMHGGFSALRGACPMNIEARLPEVGALALRDRPVVMRLETYCLPVPADIRAYMDRVRQLPGVRAWIEDAQQEREFLDFEEPYRLGRGD